MTNPSTTETDRYPYELAIINMIFVLFAVGAVLDDSPTELRFRVIIPSVLLVAASMLLVRTFRAGYLPTRVTTTRLQDDQRNLPGWTTVVLTVANLALIPATLLA